MLARSFAMAHTDESWFTYFHRDQANPRGSKDGATFQTTNGAVMMEITPASPFRKSHPNTEKLRTEFEDNVRMAGAAREMFVSLKHLVQAAIDAGMPMDTPAIRNALVAIERAAPYKYDVVHDGLKKYRGTHDECFRYIMDSQGQSVDYAINYGGWGIEPPAATDPAADAAPAPRM
jgi:hypothetical protein